MAPAGNLIFVVMIIIVHTVKSTVIMNLNETKIVKKGDEVDLKHRYKPKFINSPNVFHGMNLNEYNVIKNQVQTYPRPEIIQYSSLSTLPSTIFGLITALPTFIWIISGLG